MLASANFIDVHPNVQLRLAEMLTAVIGRNALWRYTTRDAISAPPLASIPDAA